MHFRWKEARLVLDNTGNIDQTFDDVKNEALAVVGQEEDGLTPQGAQQSRCHLFNDPTALCRFFFSTALVAYVGLAKETNVISIRSRKHKIK